MKFGILLCDDHYPEAVEKFGQYNDAFQGILPTNRDIEYHTWRCHLGEFPNSSDDCDTWLVSGSKWSVYDEDRWIRQLTVFIREIDRADKKLMGVCFGHQVIHYALGGAVNKSPKGWGLGRYPIEVKASFLDLSQGKKLNLIAMHQDQVEQPAPAFVTVAGSDFCPHAITVKDKRILTIQAHPEFEIDFFIQLCERVRTKAGDEKVNQAQQDVQQSSEGDRGHIIELIHQFYFGSTSLKNS